MKDFLKSAETGIWKDPKVAGLELRKGKKACTWYLRFRDGERTVTRTLGKHPAVSLTLARDRALQVLAGRKSGRSAAPKELVTLEELFQEYYLDHGCRTKTAVDTARAFRKIWAAHLKKPAAAIPAAVIAEEEVRWRHIPARFRHGLTALRAAYNWGLRHDLVHRNPAAAFRLPAPPPRKHQMPLDLIPRFREVLASGIIREDNAALFYLSLLCGQRPGNMRKMRFDQIAGEVWTIPADKTKTERTYSVYLGEEELEIIRIQRQRHPESEWVFPSPKKANAPVGQPWLAWHKVRQALGDPRLRTQDLRTTHATVMLNAGAAIEEVSKRLNHTSVATTQKYYADLLLDRERSAVKKFKAALQKTEKTE